VREIRLRIFLTRFGSYCQEMPTRCRHPVSLHAKVGGILRRDVHRKGAHSTISRSKQ